MAVDVSKIPNNNKFDPVREAILKLQQDVTDGVAGVATVNSSDGNITITNSGNITVGTVGETITIGINDSSYLTSADLSDYLLLTDTGEQTIAGDIVISGDLTVSGTTTFIDTDHLNIGDNIITLNADLPSGTAPTENAGIEINRGSSPTVDFLWNETSNEWDLQTYSGARIYRYGAGSTTLTIEAGSTAGDAVIALTPNTTGLGGVIKTTNERPIAFQPNSTTKVIIASDGNMNVYEKLAVGKTTAASTYPLEVDGAVLASDFKAQMTAGAATYTGTVDQYYGSLQIRTDSGGTISLGGSGTGSVQNNVFIKDGDLDVNGDVTADNFIGDGSQLTNLPGGSDTLQDVTDNGATTTNSISIGTSATPEATLQLGNNDGTRRILLYGANSQATSSELIFGDSSSDTTVYKYGAGFRFNTEDNILSIRSWFSGANSQDISLVDFYRNTGSVSTPIQFRYDSSFDGSVGIGTSTPAVKLDVKDSSSGEFTALHLTNTFDDNNASSNPLVSMWLNAASNNGYLRLYGAPADTASKHRFDIGSTAGSSFITFSTSADEKMRIANDGKIGIGTSSPTDKLQIDAANSQLRLRDTDDGTFTQFSSSGNLLAIRQNSTTASHFWMNSSGNVGLGTNTPSYKLDVSGNARVTTGLFLDRTTGQPNIKGTGEGHIIIDALDNSHNVYLNNYVSGKVLLANGGGNVGIGTTSPSEKLTIASGNISMSDSYSIKWGNNYLTGLDSVDALRLFTAGAERIRIDSSGNVGIGTTSPVGKLTISQNVNSTADFSWLVFDNQASGYGDWNIYKSGNNNLAFGYGTSNGSSYTNAVTLAYGGNVGIGTSSPDRQFEIENSGDAWFRLKGNGAYFDFLMDGNLRMFNSGGERMRITSGGNVGIGVTSPNNKLDIDSDYTNSVHIQGTGSHNLYSYHDSGGVGWATGSGSSYTNLIYMHSTANAIRIYTNGSERMRIDSSGNVGIGRTPVAAALEVEGQIRVTGTSGYTFHAGGDTDGGMFSTGDGTINFRTNGSERIRIDSSGNVGINATSPQVKLEVRGDILRSSIRVSDSRRYPVGRFNEGEQVFGIDPTWSQNELRQFFNSNNVSWNADSTAPGGYAIYINGGVNVGGQYTSGFPYIPVDQDDYFYMEVWIRNAGSGQTHYMGSNEYNQNFSSLGGHPGSFGYWVMSNTNPGSSWTKVSGYIGGFSASTVGTFENGTKYWTPLALFNYGSGSGTRACYISGWKVYRVTQQGRRKFTGAVGVLGGSYSASVDSVSDASLVVKQGRKIYSLANSDQYLRNLIEHNSSNNIVIGQTGTGLIADVEIKTGSSGNFKVFTNGGETMRVDSAAKLHVENDIIAFSSTVSDARLKDDVVTIDNALDKVKALRGVEYVWNKGGREGHKDLGFIAQEVEQVIPEIVRENEMPLMDDSGETYKTVDYEKVVAVLVEAMKEQQKQIDELKARLDGSTN